MKRAGWVACIAAVAAIGLNCSSSSSDEPLGYPGMYFPPGDDDVEVDAGGDATLDATFDATPYFNADGWIGLQGFDPSCGIYSAPSPSAKNFPPPIAWQPCEARFFGADDAGPDGGSIACEEMADNWDSGVPLDGGLTPFGATGAAYVDRGTQRVVIPVARFFADHEVAIVAEADGPVHQAFSIHPVGHVCALGLFDSISAQNVVYHVEEYDSLGETPLLSAAIGGDFDEPITTLRIEKTADIELNQVAAGANIFADVDEDGIHFGAWADGHDVAPTYDSKPRESVFQGDYLFFSSFDGDSPDPIQLTHAGASPISFLTPAADHAASEFGTDGTDMVWLEATGSLGDGAWTTIDIMTAPYATDASAIVKRRLRSDQSSPFDRPFIVGCGFAVRQESDAVSEGLRLVRISDGQSWRLATNPQSLDLPIAITCSEIFVSVSYADSNLVRIRLDSLGPGDPPD